MTNKTQEEIFEQIEGHSDLKVVYGFSMKSVLLDIAAITANIPPTFFEVQFLSDKAKSENQITRRSVAALLASFNCQNSEDLITNLLQDKDYVVRIFAIKSLEDKGLKKCPPELLSLLGDPNIDVRKEAVVCVGQIADPNTFVHYLKKMYDPDIDSFDVLRYLNDFPTPPPQIDVLRMIYQEWFSSYNGRLQSLIRRWVNEMDIEWQNKIQILTEVIKNSLITWSDMDATIIHAVRGKNGEVTVSGVANQLVNIVVQNSFDARELGIFARFILELLGGGSVGEKPATMLLIEKRNSCKENGDAVGAERINHFIRHITRGQTEDEVLGQLQEGFQVNYVEVAATLTERTMKEWETTVGQAKLGFIARLWMNIIMFALGVTLTICGVILLFMSDFAELEALVGSGVSLVAGIATMTATLFFGPLREIAKSVADVGVLNTSLIGYIHRVLQISHTFEYLYITQAIDLQQLESINQLVDRATQTTASNLFELITRNKKENLPSSISSNLPNP